MKPTVERVIQFGEGGFLRGFADWILQTANEKKAFDGSVVVVQPIPAGMCDQLTSQNCTYNLIMRGIADGACVTEVKKIDVISRCVKPYDDYEGYLRLADESSFRFVISNTTESGIYLHEGDMLTDRPPHSFPAKVAALLYRRFLAGLPGFIFLPCELIDRNGDTLKSIVKRYAAEWNLGEAFIRWIDSENFFCNTLVDRIVTGYPKDEALDLKASDAMLDTCELFHLWVIECPEKVRGELTFANCEGLNIILTDNMEPYRTRKVRILNGAHTSMVPYAILCGKETVRECMQDPEISAFVKSCVWDEIIPTLDLPRDELLAYAADVFMRFMNPYINHRCASICLNSVSKFKVRVLPSLTEYIKRTGKMPEKLLFSFARLIDFYKTDMTNDYPAVTAFMKKSSVQEILGNAELWGENLSHLAPEVQKYVDKNSPRR